MLQYILYAYSCFRSKLNLAGGTSFKKICKSSILGIYLILFLEKTVQTCGKKMCFQTAVIEMLNFSYNSDIYRTKNYL